MKPRASCAIEVTLEFGRPSEIVKRSHPRGGVSRLSIFMKLFMKGLTVAGSLDSAFGAAIADRATKSATTHATVSFCTMLLARNIHDRERVHRTSAVILHTPTSSGREVLQG